MAVAGGFGVGVGTAVAVAVGGSVVVAVEAGCATLIVSVGDGATSVPPLHASIITPAAMPRHNAECSAREIFANKLTSVTTPGLILYS